MKNMYKSFFLFLIFACVHGQDGWVFKAGYNYSAFRDADNEVITGYSLGIEKNYRINDFIKVSPEIFVSNQGGMIRNVPVWSDVFDESLDAYDIKAQMQMIDLSVLFKAYRYISDKLQIDFGIGPSYRIALHDNSVLFNQQNIFSSGQVPEEYKNYDFKYKKGEHAFVNTSGWSLHSNIVLFYMNFMLELRYSYSYHGIGYVDILDWISKKNHAMHILVGIGL